MTRLWLVVPLLAWLSAATILCAQTSPATRPTLALRPLIDQLDDRAADRREAAVEELMNLSADELPRLRQAVADAPPISANQAAHLRQVVEQVYLSGLSYPLDPQRAPFLGLFWPPSEGSLEQDSSMRIAMRLPGFDSNRVLHEGDTVIAVDDVAAPSKNDFINLIRAHYHPGDSLRLTLNRHGRVVDITCRVGVRPAYLQQVDFDQITAWTNLRLGQADAYWRTTFAPLVDVPPAT